MNIKYLALMLVIMLFGCSEEKAPNVSSRSEGSETPTVYVSNYPLQYFAERISAPLIDVRFPVPEDEDPAFWKPSPEDVMSMQQADIVLLNGAEFVEASRMLGVKILTQFPKPEDQPAMVDAIFRTLTSRSPESHERELFLNLYQEQLAYYQSAPKEAAALLKVGHAPKSKIIDDASQAAATNLANTISNLDECLLKR